MKIRNEKIEQLKDSILSIGLDYVNGGNSMDKEECPFCKSSNNYDHQHKNINTMDNIKHDDDCPYILIKEINYEESLSDLFNSRNLLNKKIENITKGYLESMDDKTKLNSFNSFDNLNIDNEDEWSYYLNHFNENIEIRWEETESGCSGSSIDVIEFTIPASFIKIFEDGDLEKEKENLLENRKKIEKLNKLKIFYISETASFNKKISKIESLIIRSSRDYLELTGKEINKSDISEKEKEIQEFKTIIKELEDKKLSINLEISNINKGK